MFVIVFCKKNIIFIDKIYVCGNLIWIFGKMKNVLLFIKFIWKYILFLIYVCFFNVKKVSWKKYLDGY